MALVKRKRKSRATVPGRGRGKPKRVFTDIQMKKMGELALAGAQTETIATLMGVPRETIDSRPDIQTFLTKKRAARKMKLRGQQDKATKEGVPSLLIWMGKQTLGQVDKREVDVSGNLNVTVVDYGKSDAAV